MSTISVDTVEDRSAGESVDAAYLVHGSLKAWAALDGSTSTAKDSLNVSSIDDDGTGDWGVNMTSAFGTSAGYVVTTSAGDSDHQILVNDGQAASAFELHCRESTTSPTDAERASAMAAGALA